MNESTETKDVAATESRTETGASLSPRTRTNRRRKWTAGFLVLVAFILGLYAARSPILTAVGDWLIYSDPVRPADYVAYLGGQDCCDAALHRLDRNLADSLLIWEQTPDRLVELGIWKSALRKTCEYIEGNRGLDSVPHLILEEEIESEGHLFASFHALAESDGPVQIVLCCPEWESRRLRDAVDHAMTSSQIRVDIYAVDDTPLTPQNWWRSRSGIRAVIWSLLNVFSARISRDRQSTYCRLSTADFRRAAVVDVP